MAGRPRTDLETQAPRSRRRNKGLENPKGLALGAPVAPPDWLTSVAGKTCFHDLQVPLIAAEILQSLDIPNLALMAQFWSDYIEARDMIRKASKTSASYVKANGRDELFSWMMESLKQYQALLAKFAGSPIDRTKIVIRKPKAKSGVEGIFQDEGAGGGGE